MIKSLSQLSHVLKDQEQRHIVIAAADEEELLLAQQATAAGLARFTLIGDKVRLDTLAKQHDIELDNFNLIHIPDHEEAARTAVQMICEKRADLPMKGLMHTGSFLKAVLNKSCGLATSQRISQITLFNGYAGDLQFLTDCAINIKPTLHEKKEIIENVVHVAQQFGYSQPLVALLGAVETVSESMPDTIDSAVLTQMNRRGQISGCIIDGPLSLDNAICPEATQHKNIVSPVAGRANILVAADLQSANTLSKALNYYANIETASIIVGTRSPIIMTSRTDKLANKLNSIAASCYLYRR